MKKLTTLITIAAAFALTMGFSGVASAATIGCGQCHGTAPTSSNAAEQATQRRTGYEATPWFEDSKTPVSADICNTNGRGLHGIHMNYSSATYAAASTKTIPAGQPGAGSYYYTRGKCDYCHNQTSGAGHIHENGYVEFGAFTTNAAPSKRRQLLRTNVVATGTGIGVNGLDITAMTGTASCTSACHKGTSVSNPAAWGNYTSSSIRLSCNSCHDDVTNSGATLSGVHSTHLGSSAAISGGTAMNASANAGCTDCHTNNTGEGRAANDFGAKAYPHATDGTNVVSANASVTNLISGATPNNNASLVTCTAACHPRSNQIGSPSNWAGGALDCNMCHYYSASPTAVGNDAIAAGSLPGAHDIHFNVGIGCISCHDAQVGTAHATALPVSSTGVTFATAAGASGSGMNITCQNTCHPVVSPSFNTIVKTVGCATCHSYPRSFGAGQGVWASKNGHSVRASALQNATTAVIRKSVKHLNYSTIYNRLTDTYAGVTGDPKKCGACHAGGTHANGTRDVAVSNGLGTSCATNFTFNMGTSTNVTNHSNSTCSSVYCHFGRVTPNWN